MMLKSSHSQNHIWQYKWKCFETESNDNVITNLYKNYDRQIRIVPSSLTTVVNEKTEVRDLR